jgi:hypothetical protein
MLKRFFPFCAGVVFFVSGLVSPIMAGHIYQNFETDDGSAIVVWPAGSASVSVTGRDETAHLGRQAVKVINSGYWSGFGVSARGSSGYTDLRGNDNDRLTFWTYALPQRECYVYGCDEGTDNTVGVVFYDNGLWSQNGYEVWTTPKARYREWTELEIYFTQLPPEFDLANVSGIEFKNYLPGTYYFDDIHASRESRVYQSFNRDERADSADSDYGWKWNDSDIVGLSSEGDPVFEGGHSWKMVLDGYWGGGGIQSGQQTFYEESQSFWHTNFLPEQNDRLSLRVYALPVNGMDNNLNVQFYDHGRHATDQTKVENWTRTPLVFGSWTRVEIPFADLPSDFDLTDIDKIQIQHYWPGTYFIDDLRATGPRPVIREAPLSKGRVSWSSVSGAENYRLQQSTSGENGPWTTVYSGPSTKYPLRSLQRSWVRVRGEQAFSGRDSLPYASAWSDPVAVVPARVNLQYASLQNGRIVWNEIPHTRVYEVEKAPAAQGPWDVVYKGPRWAAGSLIAEIGRWYRVRPIKQTRGKLADFGPWSRPQRYWPAGFGYVKASGTVLRDNDGAGDELILGGVNLGNYLLTEDWMTGFGLADDPPIPDDWTLRQVLTSRFGEKQTDDLLKNFQKAYLNDYDFDRFLDLNVTLVRLPVFYRNLMRDNGTFILNSKGEIDFSAIDRVVDAMANRGIYVLLDLHGAPGGQSPEFHTGRKDFDKLFLKNKTGETCRRRTERLWSEIARRYKDNQWVLGYDLLNEPTGADSNSLAAMYARLYSAIREVDPRHLIVMEGIWDWDTLPHPASYGWTNVMYQFHYYCPMVSGPGGPGDPVPVLGESCPDYGDMPFRLEYQQAFINKKITDSRQATYGVPVMIGEFNAYDFKDAWQFYLETLNAQKWSWTIWSYKDRSSPSSWGLYNHTFFDEPLPKFRSPQADGSPGDAYKDLKRKLGKYTTADYHRPNVTLSNLMAAEIRYPLYRTDRPEIFSVSPGRVTSPGTFVLTGRNFGSSQGLSVVDIGGLALTPIRWSDASIEVYFPTGQGRGSRKVKITAPWGASNSVDVIIMPPSKTYSSVEIVPGPDGASFALTGAGLCDTPGKVQFVPYICRDVPPGSTACNYGDSAITFWSETLITGHVPPDYSPGSFGGPQVRCEYGGELYPTMLPL